MDNLLETPPGNANCQIEVGGQVGGGQAGIFPVYTEKKESKKKQPRTLRTGLECARWELSHAPPRRIPQAGGGITSRSAHPYRRTRCSWLLNLGIELSDDKVGALVGGIRTLLLARQHCSQGLDEVS